MGASQSSGSSNNGANTWNSTGTSVNSPTSMTSTSSATSDHQQQEMSKPDMTTSDILITSAPPPQMGKMETFEEKVWRKVCRITLLCARTYMHFSPVYLVIV
jgi:hypothetical protein